MAPKSPWKSTPNGVKKMIVASSPSKQPETPINTTDYAQAQNDELDVLQAIYMEDYVEVETKGAWSKHADKAFRLLLKPMSDSDISVTLFVKLTATYPKTVPSITIHESVGLRNKTLKTIEKLLKSKPVELLGEVMIHEVASAVQDILEDEALFKDQGKTLPSLEEERVVKEAESNKLAKKQEEEDLRRKEEAKAEEDRVLQQMVEDEMNRRKEAKRKSRLVTSPVTANSEWQLHQIFF